MSDSEFLDDTEQNVSASHSKLLEAVSQLDKGQRVKRAERSEPTLEVSEFHLVKSGVSDSDAVIVKDLAKALGKKSHHLDIIRNLEATRKKINVLEKPLEKPAAERIKRIVGFENTKNELKKWNAVITKNRTAESIRFPLNKPSMQLEPPKGFVSRFRIQSDLQKELAALEPQKENIKEPNDDFSLTMNEIIMKRKEAAKIRAQQSYKEAKSRRQNKIKSKKFHRVQKKEKMKLQLKEFDKLKKTDPEAALEKLEELDRIRAEERMTLRHKSTGKWAQSKQIRAKYDKETQQELAQQLSIGRELTQKSRKANDSEEENEIDDSPVQPSATDAENPWVQNVKTDSEINDFIKSYRNYWDNEKNQLANQTTKVNDKNKSDNQETKTSVGNLGSDFVFEESKETKTAERNRKVEDERVNNDAKSFEIKSDKEHPRIEESKNETDTHISSKRSTKRTSVDDDKTSNKRLKSQKKGLKKIIATSAWDVEPVEENVQNKSSPSSNISNTEKISKIFNDMEEKMQDQIKTKLQKVTEKYNKLIKKPKHKNNEPVVEKDHFDGLEMQTANKKIIIDTSLHEDVNETNLEKDVGTNINLENARNINYSNNISVNQPNRNKENKSETEIDPSKYMNVKPKYLHTDLPTDITGGDDVLDDSENEDEKYNVISEAFADDDVVEEFRNEKEEWVKESQPKNIDLTLPGWGSWGGTNIKVSQRKTKRFILKFPKDGRRRKENKGNVIVFQDDKAKIKEHQISELPYPFTSVKDYEASIRMPIGRNFVSENAHRKLIEPVVKTSMGKVIEPMTEDVLVKKSEKKFKNPIVKRRNKIIKKRGIK